MSEEAQYTELVPEYKNKSRFPILSRYRDLIIFVKAAFSDGKISDDEFEQISTIEKDILLEYQVAAEVFSSMNFNAPHYNAAQKLLNHLHRCNVFMQFAYDQAKLKRAIDSGSAPVAVRDMYREKIALTDNKVIQLTTTMTGVELLKELETPKKRIEAELPQIRRNLAKLSPEERAEVEAKVNAIIEQMKDRQIEQLSVHELNRLIGLEQYLGEGVRVRV